MTIAVDVEEKTISPLRHLHNTATSLEKFRIQLSNRVSAITRGVDDAPQIYVDLADAILQLEQKVDDSISVELRHWPVYRDWLSHVKGIGPSLSGQMLSLLLPPIPGKGPSSWYKAAGLAPELRPDGLSRLPRARAGEGKITYHPWLRRCLWNVATSFVRNGGYYREVYDRGKARLLEQHAGDADWPPHRVDSVARWRTVKLFLSHLWEQWCAIEGIVCRSPYVLEYGGHDTMIPAPQWNGKEKI